MACILVFNFCSNKNNNEGVKIMSFNIRLDIDTNANAWENRREGVIQVIKKNNPGIIGFQEVLPSQQKYLNKHLINYVFVGNGRDGENNGEACPIFYDTTKYRKIKSGTFWLSESMDTAQLGWDAAYPRICTYGLFKDKLSNKDFWVFNTHLDNKGKLAREYGALLIIKQINDKTKTHEPLLLMGDMNCLPTSKPIQVLRNKMLYAGEVSEKDFKGPSGTYNGFNANSELKERIDYIFVSNMDVESYEHISEKLANNNCISDHLPILCKIKLH